jgi:hypothetical protein
MKFHPDVLAVHAEFGGDLQSMQALYDRPDHIARIAALEAQLAEMAPAPDAETYYSKGKDADWFEKLDNKAFAWELMCAAQDLNDTGIDEPVTAWMPVLAMLSGAAERLYALEVTPPAPKVTDEMVERACRIHNVGWSLWKEHQKKTAREVMRVALTAAQEAGKP